MTTRELTHEVAGCRMSFSIDGAGTPVLFIQGTGVHGAAWQPQIDVLRAQHTCLSFDNRGMGKSQPQGAKITIPQMASDALALMDAAGWDDAHIVGHSLGGIVAQELALQAPMRVRSLSLLCTFSRGLDAMQLSPWMIWTGFRSRVGTRAMRRAAFLEFMLSPAELTQVDVAILAKQLEPVFGHDLADQPPVVIAQMRAMGGYDASPRLAEIAHIPTLVVSAESDRISPPWVGRKIAANFAGARYEELPDASHGVPVMQADVINGLLRDHFLAVDGRKNRTASGGRP
ncbi:MAG: alpha/beta fold hydrolase [Phycisphaerae bacterium]|nr:alpha/beta fold hydrolase [Gemmatimonadaceae bacterium]